MSTLTANLEQEIVDLIQRQGLRPVKSIGEWKLYCGNGAMFLNLSTFARALAERLEEIRR